MVKLANFNTTHVFLILFQFVGMTFSLKCYICHTNDNSLCSDQFLQECPQNQAYDRCMTRIFKKPTDGLHIKKECALGPCHLPDPVLDFITFKDQCKNNDEDCIHCCPTDGCNKDGVPLISAHNLLIISMISLSVLSFLSYSSTINLSYN